MFIYETTIRMQQTDAAGVMFFGAIYGILHDAYEEFLTKQGLPFGTILQGRPYLVPIVHSEADHHRPLTVGTRIQVRISLEKMGTASFTLSYQVVPVNETSPAITARTVHVAVDKATQRSLPLPKEIKEVLAGI